jgi:hypothetical protein
MQGVKPVRVRTFSKKVEPSMKCSSQVSPVWTKTQLGIRRLGFRIRILAVSAFNPLEA